MAEAKLLISNLNFGEEFCLPDNVAGRAIASQRGLPGPRGTIAAHEEMLDRLNEGSPTPRFEAYDLTPTRALAASIKREVRDNPERHKIDQLFPIGHEVWNPGIPTGIGRSIRRRSIMPLALTAIMMEQHDSLHFFQWMNDNVGQTPVTVCGEEKDHGRLRDYTDYYFSGAATQAKPELLQATLGDLVIDRVVGTGEMHPYYKGISELPSKLAGRGIGSGLIIDTHWAQSGAQNDSNLRLDPEALLGSIEMFGIPLERVHAAAGRVDPGTTDPKDVERTLGDLAAIITSPEAISKRQFGEILLRSVALCRQQRLDKPWPNDVLITLEVPKEGWEKLRRRQGYTDPMTESTFVELTKEAADNLKGFLASQRL